MPQVNLEMLLPVAPLHPVTICHYLVILGALWMVISAGDEGTMMNTMMAAGIALMAVVNLYANVLGVLGFIIFAVRSIMVMLCVVQAGMAPNPKARGFALILFLVALPILVVLFLPPYLGGFEVDPYY